MAAESMPLFPLNTVLYPGGHLPLQIFEIRYLDLIRKCLREKTPFGVISLLDGHEVRKPGEAPLFADIGTLAEVIECEAPMPSLLKIETRGTQRFKLLSVGQQKNGLWIGQIERQADDPDVDVPEHLQAARYTLEQLIETLASGELNEEQIPVKGPLQLDNCSWVANRWCELLPLQKSTKLQLLALDNPLIRLELVNDTLEEQGLI
jgi:Lon protease-like protein